MKRFCLLFVFCILLCGCSGKEKVNDIVGEWEGLGVYIDGKLTMSEEANMVISAIIREDNTYEFTVNNTKLIGVWAEIDSSSLNDGEKAFNFVSNEGETIGQGILSNNKTFINKNSTYSLAIGFDQGNLWVEFER